jgi:hypothetical protein
VVAGAGACRSARIARMSRWLGISAEAGSAAAAAATRALWSTQKQCAAASAALDLQCGK